MSFKKEKIILRICGVLLILSSIIPIGIGIFLTYGKDFIVENIIPGEDVEVISRMVAGGLQTFLTGFIALFEGIAALLAARKDKYSRYAWALSIFGLTACAYNYLESLINNPSDRSIWIDFLVNLFINCAICLCALKIRNVYINNKETEV